MTASNAIASRPHRRGPLARSKAPRRFVGDPGDGRLQDDRRSGPRRRLDVDRQLATPPDPRLAGADDASHPHGARLERTVIAAARAASRFHRPLPRHRRRQQPPHRRRAERRRQRGIGDVRRRRDPLDAERSGVRPRVSISVEAYNAEGTGDPPIRVSYMRYIAEPPQCGDWSTNLAYDPMNLPYPNLGCATAAQPCRAGCQPRRPAWTAYRDRPRERSPRPGVGQVRQGCGDRCRGGARVGLGSGLREDQPVRDEH